MDCLFYRAGYPTKIINPTKNAKSSLHPINRHSLRLRIWLAALICVELAHLLLPAVLPPPPPGKGEGPFQPLQMDRVLFNCGNLCWRKPHK